MHAAQDRAFRIGQRRHVKVYRLLSAGSMEEIIYQRQVMSPKFPAFAGILVEWFADGCLLFEQVYKQQLVNISMEASHERRFQNPPKPRDGRF